MNEKNRPRTLALSKETVFNLMEPTGEIWGGGIVYEPSMYGSCSPSVCRECVTDRCTAGFACPK